MDNKIKRDLTLINLVTDFENKYELGEVGYMEEKVLFQLLEYYEDEYLLDKALEVVDYAIELYKYRSEFYIIKSRILLNSGKTDESLKIIEIVENIAPFERENILLKARALAIKKQFDQAKNVLDDLWYGATASDTVDLLIAESYIYENMKDYNAMYDALAKAVIIDSKNEEAMERVWISAELSRRYEDSVALHKNIIDADPYNYQAWYNLGHGYNCIWEYEKAIDALEYSFIINPDFESAYLDCADTCLQIKEYEKALDIYKEANSKFGPNDELMVNIAHCNIALDKTNIAKQWLLKAIKLDTFNDEALYLLGQCYASEKIWYNAINAYHKAIQIDNRREEYYLGLAKAYEAIEDYSKATFHFQMATQTGPEESLYWKAYISFLIKMGHLEDASQILEEAEDHTYGADLIYCRAALMYLLKDKKECLSLLEEALIENYEMHNILFEIAPEIKIDKEVTSMIKYFKDLD